MSDVEALKYDRQAFAKQLIERVETLGMKGKKADNEACSFYCGAAALAVQMLGEKHPIAQTLLAHTVFFVSCRGMFGVRELASDTFGKDHGKEDMKFPK